MAESIRETLVQYPSGNVTMRAYVAAPQTKERRPAIIVIQEWWGLTDHIKDVAKRYAAEGYVAIAPDLYSRLGNALTTDPGEAGKLMSALGGRLGALRDAFASADPTADVAQALARNVHEKVREAGGAVLSVEGEETGEWVLVDLGDIVVHVMQPSVRLYYNLEELWKSTPAQRQKAVKQAAEQAAAK